MRASAAVCLAAVLLACAGSGPAAPGPERVPTGNWGGPHVRLVVGDAGAQVEFDCAHGTLAGPLALDAEGRFSVRGTFVREAGPVREDERGEPVVYAGRTDGETMDLTVTAEGGDSIGTFTLRRGVGTRLTKCL
jgi:hypothetical protein